MGRHAEEQHPLTIGPCDMKCGREAQYSDDFYGYLCKICYWRRVVFAIRNPYTGARLYAEPRCAEVSTEPTTRGAVCELERGHRGDHGGRHPVPTTFGTKVYMTWKRRKTGALV